MKFSMQAWPWTSTSSLILLLLVAVVGNAAELRQPNVVFILADDLGWRDLSVEGSDFYESPNVDRIANEGMRFTRGYASCQVCSPSRASIMTGKYPARLKITDWIGAAAGTDWKRNTRLLPAQYQRHLPHDDLTMAEAFRKNGYRTFFAGKWHLGGQGSFPEDHGFEINVGGHHRGSPPGGFFSPYKNPKMNDGPLGESLPIRLGEEAARFIEENKDEKFFCFLSFYSVHAPLQTTQPLWAKYRRKAAKNPPPESRFMIDRTTPVRQVQDHPVYGGMVEAMDTAVGIVLKTLDRLKLTENTIVVFTSDNGGVSAGDGKATSNLPLRGGKGRQWEGGIREPYYIRWPAVVKAGSTSSVRVIGTDFYPTLLDLAGLSSQPTQHVDGVSLVPLIHGETIEQRDLFWHYPHYGNQGGEPSAIIISKDWKLIHYYEDGRRELYHLTEDVGEQHDLAAQHPNRVQQLGQRLVTWLAETEAEMPINNPNFSEERAKQNRQRIRNRDLPNLESAANNVLKENWSPNPTWWGTLTR
jgi:arylsulfatase A-like enzyme